MSLHVPPCLKRFAEASTTEALSNYNLPGFSPSINVRNQALTGDLDDLYMQKSMLRRRSVEQRFDPSAFPVLPLAAGISLPPQHNRCTRPLAWPSMQGPTEHPEPLLSPISSRIEQMTSCTVSQRVDSSRRSTTGSGRSARKKVMSLHASQMRPAPHANGQPSWAAPCFLQHGLLPPRAHSPGHLAANMPRSQAMHVRPLCPLSGVCLL
jgi:hypothetical protein